MEFPLRERCSLEPNLVGVIGLGLLLSCYVFSLGLLDMPFVDSLKIPSFIFGSRVEIVDNLVAGASILFSIFIYREIGERL